MSFIGDLFGGGGSTPTPPPVAPPPVMPLPDDASAKKAKRRSIAEQLARQGRAATILTDLEDKPAASAPAAGYIGTADKLGAV